MRKIGFIGQGFIGKHMADDFSKRGYDVVRYALEPEYIHNKDAVQECDLVFVAVPTPTTPKGFDDSVLRDALTLLVPGTVAVIKSTLLPGRTKELQTTFGDLVLLHSPEFLREKHAAADTRRPERTIVGVPADDVVHQEAASKVIEVLPTSPYQLVCDSTEAELIKYGGNCFLAMKVVYMNMLYDLARAKGVRYEVIADAMGAEPRIGPSHMQILDSSGHDGARVGRGAGGHCFPKDLAALIESYQQVCSDDAVGQALLQTLEAKNNDLLRSSQKDLAILDDIYGAYEATN